MLNNVNERQLNKAKKIASRGAKGRKLAVAYLVFTIFRNVLWKYTRRPLVKTVILSCIAFIFVFNASLAPLDGDEAFVTSTAASVNDSIMEAVPSIDDMDESEMSSLEEYIDNAVPDEEEMAGLDDLIASRNSGTEEEYETEEEQETYEFHRDDWNLLLVNKQHSVPDDYTFTLGTIKGSMKCDERILEPLTQMFTAAKESGINLVVCSPYRDYSRQEYLFDRKMKSYINSGMSYMDAYREASAVVTVPGTSEHQLGLAIDIISDTYSQLDYGFGETDAGLWLRDNSYKYGFILRYPEDKESITGIIYEPWHFRYVGVEAATYIYNENICLEEFIEEING
ncbi:MAG: M15 family metallopeptidase [Lachnospiraceae bacterium]|nr:M15 family metallopeptidase [Lachnospiraceae bacterium]